MRGPKDFYPRSPCGERRPRPCRSRGPNRNFYPRSPCGERHRLQDELTISILISIHALLAESDRQALHIIHAARNFYPRSPCGERPARCRIIYNAAYFYPRSPCGERLKTPCVKLSIDVFLSTLSLRRATMISVDEIPYQRHFYPRSPCGERPGHTFGGQEYQYFYPRSPCGERLP